MDGAQLVIILLVACLVLFIAIAIALVLMVVRLTLQIRSLMRSTEEAAQNVAGAMMTTRSIAGLIALVREALQRSKKGGRRE